MSPVYSLPHCTYFEQQPHQGLQLSRRQFSSRMPLGSTSNPQCISVIRAKSCIEASLTDRVQEALSAKVFTPCKPRPGKGRLGQTKLLSLLYGLPRTNGVYCNDINNTRVLREHRDEQLTVDMETKVRLGEMDSKAKEALMEELRDRKIDAIFSVNTVEDTSTSCDQLVENTQRTGNNVRSATRRGVTRN